MSAFFDQLADDTAAAVDVLGEWITLTPPGEPAIQIKAIIDREVPAGVDGIANNGAWKHQILVVNDRRRGVTSIARGQTTVTFPNTVGGAMQTFVVHRIIHQDQGGWFLGVG